MSLFTPLNGILGGSILGTSASILLLYNGDILGCSGIMRSWLQIPPTDDPMQTWKLQFMASFVVAAQLLRIGTGTNYAVGSSDVPSASWIGHLLGGFLVGWGTAMSNGCTSGHGICGLGRMSLRSLVAVMTFLSVGIGTTTILISSRMPWSSYTQLLRSNSDATSSSASPELGWIITGLGVGYALWSQQLQQQRGRKESTSHKRSIWIAGLCGAMFAIGLALSGMAQTSKVLGFLDVSPLLVGMASDYDPTLLCVLGSAVPISWMSYQYMYYRKRSSSDNGGAKLWSNIPTSTTIDGSLIGGAVCFGVGWGLTGICPGPALFAAASGIDNVVLCFLPMFFVGSYLAMRTKDLYAKKKI